MSNSGRGRGYFGESSTFDVRSKSADIYISHKDSKKASTDYETEIKRIMLVEARLGLPDVLFKRHFGSENTGTIRKVGLWDTNSVSADDAVGQTGSTSLERNPAPYQVPAVTTPPAIHPVVDRVGDAIEHHNFLQRVPIPDIAHHNLPQNHPVPKTSTPNYGTSNALNKVKPGKANKWRGGQKKNSGLNVCLPGPVAAQPQSAQGTRSNAPISNGMQPGKIIHKGLYNQSQFPKQNAGLNVCLPAPVAAQPQSAQNTRNNAPISNGIQPGKITHDNQPQFPRQNPGLDVRLPGPMAAQPQSVQNTQNNAPISNWMRVGNTIHDGQSNQPQFPANPEACPIPTNNLPHPLQPRLWIPTESCLTTKFFTSAFLPPSFDSGIGRDLFKPQHTEVEIYGRIELGVFMGQIYQAHGIGPHLIVVALDIGIGPKAFHINLNSPLADVDWIMIMGFVQLGCWSTGRITAIVHHRALFRPGN